MKHTSGGLLELESLKALLGRYVASPLGRAELAKVAPSRDREAIQAALEETAEAIEYLAAAARPHPAARGAPVRIRFEDLPDVAESVRKLRIEGTVLEARQLFEITDLLDRASDVRALLLAAEERSPLLARRAALIGEFRGLLEDLSGKILPDGSVADHASVALNRLRREIERQQKLIQESLERFLRAHREDGVLQEEFVTIRNERFVVPVVSGRQRRIEGVVHGSSGSGHTLFVEPLETIELNNELVRLNEEEMREVHRILRELSERLRGHAAAIARTCEAMAALELDFAKARFASDFGAVIPRFSPPGARRLALREARHPLLEDVLKRQRKPVVPVSLELDESARTLLISGPNTGGKTVTLKTAGLLALMAQSALPVPAVEAEFPLFEGVLADIGDNQSIQESLSTFSAHITRIRDMASEAGADSLVLLDELGRATDPEEGGALGIAVLEHFRAAGCFTLASTHLMALKVYGATTAGVLNGSMGFDEVTLEPTYLLKVGAPGKSAGLDIAARLGLPPALIEQARAVMSSSDRDVARFLSELHQRIEELAAERDRLRQQQAALAAREKSLAKEWADRESAKLKELERRCELLMVRFEGQARETIESILAGAEQRKAASQAQRKVAKARREFEEEVRTTILSTQDAARQGELGLGRPKIQEGARVRLKGVREPGRVRRKLAGDILEVEVGFLKMQAPVEDVLEVLPDSGETARLPQNVTFQPGPRWNVTYREINVIGKRAEEAVEEVDRFLDQAALATIDRVRIVHGHGMGILKRAIADLLAGHPHVDKFYAAPQNEGGAGATIVELKTPA